MSLEHTTTRSENTSFFGTSYPGRYGFYWQVDQMLFREPSPEEPAPLAKGPTDGKSVADGKSAKPFKEPVPSKKPKLSDQGLYLFSLFYLRTQVQQHPAVLFSYRASSIKG